MFKCLIKKLTFSATMLVATLVVATTAHAGPVDLSTWVKNGAGTSIWNVQGPNNDSVVQTVNGRPTVFFDNSAAGSSSQGKVLSGKIKVQTSIDDDFIGFVLGYNAGELYSASADYYLIDWKQATQSSGGVNGVVAQKGLALSHVTNGTNDNNFWGHTAGKVTELKRATNLGSTAWVDFVEYDFNILFTSTLIEFSVNGVTEISHSGNFSNGAFGFYNYSQQNVLYSAIQQTSIPVPEAPTLTLLGLGLLGLGLARRRNSLA